ncbi:hypothetical protein, partial [Agromyces humi]|uniref:hypothetical protein n=1 Tax=Agromyces humi TaxID=1766800 RepID=UPI001939AE4F
MPGAPWRALPVSGDPKKAIAMAMAVSLLWVNAAAPATVAVRYVAAPSSGPRAPGQKVDVSEMAIVAPASRDGFVVEAPPPPPPPPPPPA